MYIRTCAYQIGCICPTTNDMIYFRICLNTGYVFGNNCFVCFFIKNTISYCTNFQNTDFAFHFSCILTIDTNSRFKSVDYLLQPNHLPLHR